MARPLPSQFLASMLLLLFVAASAPVLAQEEEQQVVTEPEVEPYLGHGCLPDTPVEGVRAFTDAARALSSA